MSTPSLLFQRGLFCTRSNGSKALLFFSVRGIYPKLRSPGFTSIRAHRSKHRWRCLSNLAVIRVLVCICCSVLNSEGTIIWPPDTLFMHKFNFSHHSAGAMFQSCRISYAHVSRAPALCSTYHRHLHHPPPLHHNYHYHTLITSLPQPSPISSLHSRHFVTGTWTLGGTGGDRGGRMGSKKGTGGSNKACPQCGETFKSVGTVLSKLWMCN